MCYIFPHLSLTYRQWGQLLKESQIRILFQPQYRLLQNLMTREPIAVGFMREGLYKLNKKYFEPEILCKYADTNFVSFTSIVNKQNENML